MRVGRGSVLLFLPFNSTKHWGLFRACLCLLSLCVFFDGFRFGRGLWEAVQPNALPVVLVVVQKGEIATWGCSRNCEPHPQGGGKHSKLWTQSKKKPKLSQLVMFAKSLSLLSLRYSTYAELLWLKTRPWVSSSGMKSLGWVSLWLTWHFILGRGLLCSGLTGHCWVLSHCDYSCPSVSSFEETSKFIVQALGPSSMV